MSWHDRWSKRPDGRREYRDHNIDITYTISELLYEELSEMDSEERDEFLVMIMTQAAETIGRDASRNCR